MSQAIQFGTYNIGNGFGDLSSMAKHDPAQLKALNGIPDIATSTTVQDAHMQKIEQKVAGQLAGLDVIALQEVVNINRPFIQKLKESGFTIVTAPTRHQNGIIDCAIAYKADCFEQVKDLSKLSDSHADDRSLYGQTMGALILRVNSGAQLAFASLHSWGFQLYPKDHPLKEYSENDQNQSGYALTYARETIDLLNSVAVDGRIIGGDMNNNPDNFVDGFSVFENFGYETKDPGEATNVNYIDKETYNYGSRTIDYIFCAFQKSFLSKIWNVFYSILYPTFEVTASEAKVMDGFDFTIETNCSDHKPVAVTITINTHEALVTRFWKLFSGK